MSKHERRGTPRYEVQFPVRFLSELLEFEGTAELEGEVRDVSWGGLFVRSDYLETPGTPVRLLVEMPHAPVSLRGHVAWVASGPPKGPGMGIELRSDDKLPIRVR